MGILIAKHITSVLADDEATTKLAGRRIYPVVVPEGSPAFPFTVFESQVEDTEDTKDGEVYDTVKTDFMCVGQKYEDAAYLASAIRSALTKRGSVAYDEYEVERTWFAGSKEGYLDEIAAYYVELNFEFEVSNKI
jgi:hypothetical protein